MKEYLLLDLPYQRDSTALLQKFAALPGLVFLDSGIQADRNSRYDILSALPDARVVCDETQTSIVTADGQRPFTGDSFAAVDHLLRLMAPEPEAPPRMSLLPFKGGAIGFFGYEGIAEVGIYSWAIVVDHEKRQTTLFALPTCPQTTVYGVMECLAWNSPPQPPPFSLLTPFVSNFTAASYREAFERIQNYIEAGDCYQVNLAQRFSALYEGDPLQAFIRLRKGISSPFAAYLRRETGAVLSFSPERFLSVREGKVLTQPIKGTRARQADPVMDAAMGEELRNSAKDRAENLMIVDLLRNDLGTLCRIGSIKVDKLFELQTFSNVHHLVSSISATLSDDHTAMDLLRNCFPGGSITGAPKQRAMEIIAELEPHGRSVYCGAAGYIGFDGIMDMNIMIRTVLCDAPNIYCWGGGGIVADSVWSEEYQECYDKINNLIKQL